MAKRILLAICILAMAVGLGADEGKGYFLLSKMVSEFNAIAQSGEGGAPVLNKMLNGLMAEAKKAKTAGEIDDVFFFRFKRILVVLRLAAIDFPEDPEGILDEHILETVNRFIEEVSGKEGIVNQKGIGAVAKAVSEEIINLHILQSGKSDRSKIAEKYWQSKPEKKK